MEHGPSPYQANVNYLIVATFQLSYHALQMFRYRSDSIVYYAAGDESFADGAGNTNYWKMANSVRQAGSIAVWSILWLF